MAKTLNIAFVWHFHQPSYQESFDRDFLMPWVRLHATKDYLDMLYYTENFANLKLNFNFSPVLLDAIERYVNGAHDVHSRLLISEVEKLSSHEKLFILDNFFDANYNNMILPRGYYTALYEKRYSKEDPVPAEFSNQEYSDIMANFTLAWMNKKFVTHYHDLEYLFNKEVGYTLDDRRRIFEISIDKCYRICYNVVYGGVSMNIDEILKSIRSELSISQETLARDLGVSFSSLNRWENKKSKPSRLAIKQLKDYASQNNVSREVLAALEQIRI